MSTRVSLIEVPFNSAGLYTGVARMCEALVSAGLVAALHRRADVGIVSVPIMTMSSDRGPSGLIAEYALCEMVTAVCAVVQHAYEDDRFPLLVGGDCAVLLGGLIAARQTGTLGIVFVDGHEDAWDPWVSESGEAADCELGLALGFSSPPAALASMLPCLNVDSTVLIGPRDSREIEDGGWHSIANRVRLLAGAPWTDPKRLGQEEATRIASASQGWWLHVDLDVLSSAALSAVDYPQPGGMSWYQLEALTTGALRASGCVGASAVIYNPDLDDGEAASAIVSYPEILVTHAPDVVGSRPNPSR